MTRTPTGDPAPTTRERFNAFVARHEAAWELVMAALAIVFVATGFAPVEGDPEWLTAAEWALTIVFAAEFLARFGASFDRRRYLGGHWIDLVALVPSVRALRTLRLLRLLRLVRAFAGFARALASLERLANHRGLIWLLTAWLGVMILTSIALFAAEMGVNEAIESPLDGLWWGISTMTTVGYGDVVPKTPEGRLIASVLMVLGIALFSAVTAIITSFLFDRDPRDGNDPIRDLERLGHLRDEGVLTDEQLAAARDRLIERVGR